MMWRLMIGSLNNKASSNRRGFMFAEVCNDVAPKDWLT